MKRRKKLMVTGLIVAVLTITGISVYAAEDVVENVVEDVKEGIARRFGGPRGGEMGGRGQKDGAYDKAVEEGILTEAEVEAIKEYHEATRPDKEAIQEELEGLSRDEIKAYMEENYPRPEDPLADLVEAGLITEDQADQLDALREEFEAQREENGFGMGEGRGEGKFGGPGKHGGAYDKAVEEGILTEAEVEAIQAYHETTRPDMEALEEELEGLSRDEIKAFMEENYPRPEDPLADLVEAGLITQDQADQLETLREEFEAERPEGMGPGNGEGQGGHGGRGQGGRGQGMGSGRGGFGGQGQESGGQNTNTGSI